MAQKGALTKNPSGNGKPLQRLSPGVYRSASGGLVTQGGKPLPRPQQQMRQAPPQQPQPARRPPAALPSAGGNLAGTLAGMMPNNGFGGQIQQPILWNNLQQGGAENPFARFQSPKTPGTVSGMLQQNQGGMNGQEPMMRSAVYEGNGSEFGPKPFYGQPQGGGMMPNFNDKMYRYPAGQGMDWNNPGQYELYQQQAFDRANQAPYQTSMFPPERLGTQRVQDEQRMYQTMLQMQQQQQMQGQQAQPQQPNTVSGMLSQNRQG